MIYPLSLTVCVFIHPKQIQFFMGLIYLYSSNSIFVPIFTLCSRGIEKTSVISGWFFLCKFCSISLASPHITLCSSSTTCFTTASSFGQSMMSSSWICSAISHPKSSRGLHNSTIAHLSRSAADPWITLLTACRSGLVLSIEETVGVEVVVADVVGEEVGAEEEEEGWTWPSGRRRPARVSTKCCVRAWRVVWSMN